MAYSEKVLDHYENPRNVGVIEDDQSVGTGMVGAPAGEVIALDDELHTGEDLVRVLRRQDNEDLSFGEGGHILHMQLTRAFLRAPASEADELGEAGIGRPVLWEAE